MKIVICGPPKSGKSCLREGLKQAIGIQNEPYPYVITACPDGEGAWFQETMNANPELAAKCKAAYKTKFTPGFIDRVADSVKNCPLPLTLIDIGGIPSEDNEIICASATHAILLTGDLNRLREWQEFCKKAGLCIIAEIYSDYNGVKDKILKLHKDGIYRGSVHHLERGEKVHDRPTIKKLAKILIEMLNSERMGK